jgi:hypothetical protein
MAKHYNYAKLMEHNPTSYGKITNSLGQEIEFFEHPTQGDMSFVICACHELEKAADSTFFETDDMEEEHGEYEPSFQDGKLHIGDFEA